MKEKKPAGYWTEERCYEAAKECTTVKEFSKKYATAYIRSCTHGWRQNYTWLERTVKLDMVSPIYLIYVYEDEENKACYVGLTKDLIKRKSNHKHTEYYKDKEGIKHHTYDTVGRYFISINKEIPEPKILEEGLNATTAQIQEGAWIDKYREDGWNILNVANTGLHASSIGGCEVKWTDEKILEVAKTCKTAHEFKVKYDWAYKHAKARGLRKFLPELFGTPIENLEGEVWYDIPEFPKYQISNKKRVKKLPSELNMTEKLMAIFHKNKTSDVEYVAFHNNNNTKMRSLNALYRKIVLKEISYPTNVE